MIVLHMVTIYILLNLIFFLLLWVTGNQDANETLANGIHTHGQLIMLLLIISFSMIPALIAGATEHIREYNRSLHVDFDISPEGEIKNEKIRRGRRLITRADLTPDELKMLNTAEQEAIRRKMLK